MRETDSIDASLVYSELPFLYHFPFSDKYSIFYSDDDVIFNEDDDADFDIPDLVNFKYSYKSSKIVISFFKADVEFICENANRISKFDKILKKIENADLSNQFTDKVKAIKAGNNLIRKIDEEIVVGGAFDNILDVLLDNHNIELTGGQLKKIKNLSSGLLNMTLEGKTRDIVDSYLSLHLNRIKILIGIIIASKLF